MRGCNDRSMPTWMETPNLGKKTSNNLVVLYVKRPLLRLGQRYLGMCSDYNPGSLGLGDEMTMVKKAGSTPR